MEINEALNLKGFVYLFPNNQQLARMRFLPTKTQTALVVQIAEHFQLQRFLTFRSYFYT